MFKSLIGMLVLALAACTSPPPQPSASGAPQVQSAPSGDVGTAAPAALDVTLTSAQAIGAVALPAALAAPLPLGAVLCRSVADAGLQAALRPGWRYRPKRLLRLLRFDAACDDGNIRGRSRAGFDAEPGHTVLHC